jgi:hypothetical protein
VQEVDVVALMDRQALPPHAGVQLDHVPLVRMHDRAGAGRRARSCLGAVHPEDVVERDTELGDDRVERADRRLRLIRLDLRDQACRDAETP